MLDNAPIGVVDEYYDAQRNRGFFYYLPSGKAFACSISKWITRSFFTNLTPVTMKFFLMFDVAGFNDQYL